MPTKVNKNKPSLRFLKPKPIKVVTKKVLHDIANSIYNAKTGHYLNLCDGTLQNGPDPVCEQRPMHCGLGELYYVVTGRQPERDEVNEGGVIREVFKRSTLFGVDIAFKKETISNIKKMNLPPILEDRLLNEVKDFDSNFEREFLDALDDIPKKNDQGCVEDYLPRAKRVAAQLHKAADLLPR